MAYCGGVNCFFQSASVLTTFSTVTVSFFTPESSNSTKVTDTGLLLFAASTLLARPHPHATVPAQPSAADRISRLETPPSDSIATSQVTFNLNSRAALLWYILRRIVSGS